jgi:hypothetical protein
VAEDRPRWVQANVENTGRRGRLNYRRSTVARSPSGRGRKAKPNDTRDDVAAAAPAEHAAFQHDGLFTEAGGVAIAAILHLLRLTGAELVLARQDLDPTQFEHAVRAKLEQFTSPTMNPDARAAGVAFARHLVEQVLTQIRAQAEVKKSLNASEPHADKSGTQPTHPPSKLLN